MKPGDLKPGQILFDQVYRQYIKLDKFFPHDYFNNWTYRVHYRDGRWGGLSIEYDRNLKRNCRVVGRLEATVVLGEAT